MYFLYSSFSYFSLETSMACHIISICSFVKISDFITNFNLSLCHIHGQNPLGINYLDANMDPTQIEMTFSSTANIVSNEPKIPHLLDQPADFRFQDVKLKFAD